MAKRKKKPHTIACLGWGSLISDRRDLPIRGKWFCDGPMLPIEFARKSSDGRITLVIVPDTFPFLRSLWTPLAVTTLNEAREALGRRECPKATNPEECVDYWPGGSKNSKAAKEIGKWARGLRIDVVVWTNLPPKFDGKKEGEVPSAEEVVAYLDSLRQEQRELAEHYVRMTPRQIDTDYRRVIEARLGWTPKGEL